MLSVNVMLPLRRRKPSASLAVTLDSHSLSVPSPRYSYWLIDVNILTKVSCTTSATSSLSGTYRMTIAMIYPEYWS